MSTQKLYRSEADRIIGGVAGGLGDYFDLDSSLIRIIFILLVLAGGSGLFLYLLLWLIIPTKSNLADTREETVKKNAKEIEAKAKKTVDEVRKSQKINQQERGKWVGIILLILGSLLLLRNMGWLQLEVFWPVALIAIGLMILFRKQP